MSSARNHKHAELARALGTGGAYLYADLSCEGIVCPKGRADNVRGIFFIKSDHFVEGETTHALAIETTADGAPFRWSIPWRAVFAVVGLDGSIAVFGDDIPRACLPDLIGGTSQVLGVIEEGRRARRAREKTRPHLRVINGGRPTNSTPDAGQRVNAQSTSELEREG